MVHKVMPTSYVTSYVVCFYLPIATENGCHQRNILSSSVPGYPILIIYLFDIILISNAFYITFERAQRYFRIEGREPKITHSSILKAKKILKWKPKVNFEDGISELINNINYWKDSPLWNKSNITLLVLVLLDKTQRIFFV